MNLLEILGQGSIGILGFFAFLLIERANKRGYILGLLQQPFWVYSTLMAKQWGMFFITILFFYVYARGCWNNYRKKKNDPLRALGRALIKSPR